MTDAIFMPEGDRFVPTKMAGSPWGDTLVHGGPAAGLLARAIERLAGEPDMQVSRLTIDLFRPVPMAPLEATAQSVRAGKRIHAVEAALRADGVEVCRASGLLLRTSEAPVPESRGTISPPPGPDEFETSSLGRGRRPDGGGRVGFYTYIEARWVTRPGDAAPATVWMRLPLPLVAGEIATPLVRIAAIADFVNAVGGIDRQDGAGFINVDSTIYLLRLPVSEWICVQVERSIAPGGLGLATALLWYVEGLVGRATQAILANRMP